MIRRESHPLLLAALAAGLFALATPLSAGPQERARLSRHVLCGHLMVDAARLAAQGARPGIHALSRREAIDRLIDRMVVFGGFPVSIMESVERGERALPFSGHSGESRSSTEMAARRLASQLVAYSNPELAPFACTTEVVGGAIEPFAEDSLLDTPQLIQIVQQKAFARERNELRLGAGGIFLFAQVLTGVIAIACGAPYAALGGTAFGALLGTAWYNAGMDLGGTWSWQAALQECDPHWGARVENILGLVRRPTLGAWVYHSFDQPGVHLNASMRAALHDYSAGGELLPPVPDLHHLHVDLMARVDSGPGGNPVPRLNLWISGQRQ